jgi:hypothetical protein
MRLWPGTGYYTIGGPDLYVNRRRVRTTEVRCGGAVVPVYFNSFQWKANERGSLYRTVSNRFTAIRCFVAERDGPYYIFWEICGPYMAMKTGAIELQLGADEVHVSPLQLEFKVKDRNA